jgi:hypothetical protein
MNVIDPRSNNQSTMVCHDQMHRTRNRIIGDMTANSRKIPLRNGQEGIVAQGPDSVEEITGEFSSQRHTDSI